MNQSSLRIAAALFGFVTLASIEGCDAQASTHYQGEALFTLSGSVDTGDTLIEGTLVPALVFPGPRGTNAMYVVDVEVTGEFPTGFTLRTYEPPPDAALSGEEVGYPPGVRGAYGFVTALPADHPDVIVAGKPGGVSLYGMLDGQYHYEERWCLDDDSTCYVETFLCPEMELDRDACSPLNAYGDPDLKNDPWDHFAGLSQNYRVLYVDGTLPAPTVGLLGNTHGDLTTGYHLVAVRERSEAERAEVRACWHDARAQAIARYNEDFDVHITIADFETGNCEDVPDGPWCEEERMQRFRQLQFGALRELQCTLLEEIELTYIAVPNAERLTVQLGRALQPIQDFP